MTEASNNFDLMERNNLSNNSRGGTELLQERLYDGKVPRGLLEKTQVIFSRTRELSPDKKRILYLHDLAQDPESSRLSDSSFRKNFDKIIFVSNWQLDSYNALRGVEYDQSVVIKNSIQPLEVAEKPLDGKIRLIYTSTPHRGLEILVPVFIELAKANPNILLDVYSSFSIYGWSERDKPYEKLFEICRQHPQINYHGVVSNEEVRKALLKADIFAYPSIWKETSCLSLIEAMSAKLLCVHPNLAALPETGMGLTWCYQFSENLNNHAKNFFQVLSRAIDVIRNQREEIENDLILQKIQVDRNHNWNAKYLEWVALLESINNR